ncbi:MAG: helix-turn-helix domain-containing protein [Lachnospiraceae bacterium]|nr:helix-turn-helix domain-containing protein [Lachnospiraceae bacterium]
MLEEGRKKGQHLTRDDRHEIQRGLREHHSFQEISMIIGCSPDTISKEIRKHRYHKVREKNTEGSRTFYTRPNRCKHRDNCRRRDVCNKKKGHKCRIPCRECMRCNELCPDFVDAPCRVENKAPYVCNGCTKSVRCLFDKYLYNADYAQREYEEELRTSRLGIDMTRDELAALDGLVSPLICKGQPLAHILENHRDEITVSERTLYRYINTGILTARNIDMHRTVRYRKRKHYTDQPKISYKKKEGHHYTDYQEYMERNPGTRVVQMDTVEGVKGGKLLQTLLWTEHNLMLAFLRESKEMANMVATFDWLEEKLGTETFREWFPVVLTDNGCEFADPELFEKGLDGSQRTRLFYCEPRHSEQKGGLEKNHEYIRYVLPKGTSFDQLTQEHVLLMINHINNTTRPKLHGMTPMKKALLSFDKNAMEKIGLRLIPPDEVSLKPMLLK